MLHIGDFLLLKSDLKLGWKYGTVTYGPRHVEYLNRILIATKISSTGTAYTSCNGKVTECGTISEEMVNVAKYRPDEKVLTKDFSINTITRVRNVGDKFVYYLTPDDGQWSEDSLISLGSPDAQIETSRDYENRLQEQKASVSSRERIKGSGVHGRLRKTSVQGGRIRNPKAIKGS